MTVKQIPFTQDDRSTIRSTSMWMLIAGALMTASGGYMLYHLLDAFLIFGLMALRILTLPVLVAGGLFGLGILLLFASRRFSAVASDGDIRALSGGLRALTIVYVVQAILMIIGVILFFVSFLLPMFM